MTTDQETRAVTTDTYPLVVRAQSALDALTAALERETKERQEAEVQIGEIRETFSLGSTRTLVEAADDYKTAIGGAEADRAELRRTKAELERTTTDLTQLRRLWDEFVENHVPRSELDAKFVSKAEHQLALDNIQALLAVLNEIAVVPQSEPRRFARTAISNSTSRGFPLET